MNVKHETSGIWTMSGEPRGCSGFLSVPLNQPLKTEIFHGKLLQVTGNSMSEPEESEAPLAWFGFY